MSMKVQESLLERLCEEASAEIVPLGKYISPDDTFQISLSRDGKEGVSVRFLRLKGTSPGPSDLKYLGYDSRTRSLILDCFSEQIIELPRVAPPDTQTGANSIKSPTVSESSPIAGLESGESPRERQVGGNHYKDMPIQPSIFITTNNIPWYEGNAIKYLCRHSRKNGKADLEKAKHYVELALEHYYNA